MCGGSSIQPYRELLVGGVDFGDVPESRPQPSTGALAALGNFGDSYRGPTIGALMSGPWRLKRANSPELENVERIVDPSECIGDLSSPIWQSEIGDLMLSALIGDLMSPALPRLEGVCVELTDSLWPSVVSGLFSGICSWVLGVIWRDILCTAQAGIFAFCVPSRH